LAQQLIVDFVAELARTVELPEPIVEFGSLQVEPGQPGDLRALFAGRRFVGTDMRAGPGVDRIEDLRALSYAEGEVGTALCLDTLEHCEDPLQAGRELHRVLAHGGVCVASSVMMFPIHGYPSDYWRFTPEGMRRVLGAFDEAWVTGVGHPELPMQIVAVAAKGRALGLGTAPFQTLADAQGEWERADGRVRLGPLRVSLRELAGTLARELPRAGVQRATARLRGGS
jgi:SAM-dependent methyltransferase